MTAVLIAMRLKDMHLVHPDQVTHRCSECGEEVGVYPSGQRVMRSISTKLICQVCGDPSKSSGLAPGALLEPFESVKKE